MPASGSFLSALLPASAVGREPLSAVESIRLVQALRVIPDPRRRRGRRHGLQSVLLLALQAVMAGASSWMAIAQWSKTAPQALGICGVSPSAATFRRVLTAVDIAAVEAALTTWVTGRQAHARVQRPVRPAAELRTVLAVDGETLRGSVGLDGQPTKLVCVYDHAHQLVLTQTGVVAGDEMTESSWGGCRVQPARRLVLCLHHGSSIRRLGSARFGCTPTGCAMGSPSWALVARSGSCSASTRRPCGIGSSRRRRPTGRSSRRGCHWPMRMPA